MFVLFRAGSTVQDLDKISVPVRFGPRIVLFLARGGPKLTVFSSESVLHFMNLPGPGPGPTVFSVGPCICNFLGPTFHCATSYLNPMMTSLSKMSFPRDQHVTNVTEVTKVDSTGSVFHNKHL